MGESAERGSVPQPIRSKPRKSRWGRGACLALLALAALPGGCRQSPSPKAEPQARPIGFARVSDDDVRHGERLARVLGCIGCHGEDLTGENMTEPGFGAMWSANLTRSAARMSDSQFAHAMNSGRGPDERELWEMPSFLFTHLAARDIWAIVAFVRSRPVRGEEHPAPRFEPAIRREIDQGLFKSSAVQVRERGGDWPPAAPNSVIARHIVRATCAECHGMDLGGGRPHPEAAVRPDLKVVISAYERADFRRLMRTGRAVGDRELGLMGEVARGRYRYLTDGEVDAIYDYLRELGRQP